MEDSTREIHSLLPEYDPTTTIRNFRVEEDFETIRSSLLGSPPGSLYEEFFGSLDKDKEWRRPKEICKKPFFIKDKPIRFDALQGELGDCWLVQAMETLTLNDSLMKHVVPPDQSFDRDYIGAFHFRFWRLGTWYDVVVDDRIPVYKDNKKPVYAHSSCGEVFWACLLEKAFAKFCAPPSPYLEPVKYDILERGVGTTSTQCFSGGIGELVEKEIYISKATTVTQIIYDSYMNNAMIGCHFSSEKNLEIFNLLKSHNYCITKVYKCPDSDKDFPGLILLRIMNPWGYKEWQGEWSDEDYETWWKIDRKIREKLNIYETMKEDGEFWMSEYDYRKCIFTTFICHLGPGQYLKSRKLAFDFEFWATISFRGEWVKNVSAVGRSFDDRHKNPQCRIKLNWVYPGRPDRGCQSHVVIDITHWSKKGRIGFILVGFYVYSVKKKDYEKLPPFSNLKKKFFRKNRALNQDTMNFGQSLGRSYVTSMKLDCPGEYVIVPCTQLEGEESQFFLRVFTQSNIDFWENRYAKSDYGKISEAFTLEKTVVEEKDAYLRNLFYNICNGKNEIGWIELKQILEEEINPKNSAFILFTGFLNYIRAIYGRFMYSDSNRNGRIVFSKDECRSMIAMLDDDHSGKLNYSEFRNLWNKISF